MKVNDKVKFKMWPTGNPIWFYIYNSEPDAIYEVDVILHDDEVYLKGHNNYILKKFLEVIE